MVVIVAFAAGGAGCYRCLVLLLIYCFLGCGLVLIGLICCGVGWWSAVWFSIALMLWVGAYCVNSVVRLSGDCGMVRFVTRLGAF